MTFLRATYIGLIILLASTRVFAATYVVLGPAPGTITFGFVNYNAPWGLGVTAFANGDNVFVSIPTGFTVQPPTPGSTFTINGVGLSIEVDAGAIVGGDGFGNAPFNITNSGSLILQNDGTIQCDGGPNTNFLINSSGSAPALFLTNTGVGSSRGSINMATGTSGYVTLEGSGDHDGPITLGQNAFSLNLNSTGTVLGAIDVGSVQPTNNSFLNVGSSGSVTLGSTVTNVKNITISGALTTGGAITGVGALNLNTSGATLNMAHNVSGSGSLSNSGTITVQNGTTLNISGTFALSGTMNVAGQFVIPNTTSYNAGVINMNGSGTLTGGALTGTSASSALRIGPSVANTFSYTNSITNIGNIDVINGSFTTSGSITGLNTALNVSGGTSATFNADVSGSGYLGNAGTINIGSGTSFNLTQTLVNSGTINVAGAFTLPIVNTSNTGAININGSGGSLFGDLTGGVGSSLNIGTTSVGTPTAVNLSYSGNINSIAAITVQTSGTSFTASGTIIGNPTLNVAASTTAILNGNADLGAVTVNGTLFNGAGAALDLNGALTIGGTGIVNIQGACTVSSISSNTGKIYVNNGGTISGALFGGAGSELHIGKISSGTDTAAYVELDSGISGIETITLNTTSTELLVDGAITGLATELSTAAGTFATFYGSVSGAGELNNLGSIAIRNNTNFNLTGDMTNSGVINIFGEGATTTYTVPSIGSILSNTGTINIYGAGARISGAFNPGVTSATATLNIGSDAGDVKYSGTNYTTNATITKIPLINVNAGTFTINNAISEVTDFFVEDGASAIFNSSMAGILASALTNTFTTAGTVTFNTGSSISNFNLFAIRTNGNLTYNTGGTVTLPSGAQIIGGANSTNTTLNVIGATTLVASNTISDLTFINVTGGSTLETSSSISDIGTVYIDDTSTLELLTGGSVSSFGTLTLDGTLQIDAGATFTLSADQNIVQTAGHTSGQILNYGQMTLNGSTVTFPGSFTNENTGTLTLTGTPTLNFTGPSFINRGNIQATFSTSNALPTITTSDVTPDLSHGTIIIGYNNNYIAGGTYDFLLAPNSNTTIDPGLAILPQPSTYIDSWSLTSTQTAVQVFVDRSGFGAHAQTPAAQEVGNYLEELGAGNPTQAELDLLNSLEQIDNDAELTAALESLLPPQYTMLVTLDMMDAVVGALDIRLFSIQQGYGAGDTISSDTNGFWVRPFYSNGKQATTETITGFSDKCHGWILGLDRTINHNLTLGISGSITKTNVIQTNQTTTTTNINNYEGAFYGTYQTTNEAYIDGIIAGGVSNYHGTREIVLPDFNSAAYSDYTSQQITFKMMASKNYSLYDTWQLTPKALAQYSFIRTLSYTETGAGAYNMFVDPDNINLFRLGAGTSLGLPFTSNNMLSIPSVIGMVYVDANGGADTVNCQFVTGGPFITNVSQQGRIMIRLGVNYELKLNDKLQFVAGYDYYARRAFQGHDAYLNLRYTF